MKWFKSRTIELPFHTLENWRYVYFVGWPRLLGLKMMNYIFYSKENLIVIYRIKEEMDSFIKNLTKFCLEKPEAMMAYYNELERLDKQIIALRERKIETKSELKTYIQEIDSIMDHYCTIYLTKTYSNYAITKEVEEKHPELAEKAKSLLNISEWFGLSKAICQKACSILELPEKTISMLNLKEILRYIDTGIIDNELIEKRHSGFAWNLKTNEFYYGKNADGYIQKLGIAEEKTNINIVKGSAVNKGKSKGKVVVALSTKDFDKISDGCILVAHMTTPWYTPYLSKVSAIVTDEGGIGCHASIIARELNKPCIVGTKIATSVFKDGNLVEVDAEKGIIKKIK
jgi:phosphohistidine swiveling domain-containing protein